MARPINGLSGSGQVTVYLLSNTDTFRVDTLSFKLTAGAAAGIRRAQVTFLTPDGSIIARIPDENDVSPLAIVTYTFGVGLIPFACTISTGLAVKCDLPATVLEPNCTITVDSFDTAGSPIAGDQITDVLLWVEDTGADVGEGDVIPPYTLVEQAAA